MRISNPLGHALMASVALTVFAGCSGGSSRLNPVFGPITAQLPLVQPRAPVSACPKARVYVADFGSNSVPIYPQREKNPAPCGTITKGVFAPASVSVDAKGTLYVANYGNQNVTEYLRNTDVPNFTFSLGVKPEYIFVGADLTVYISSYPSNEVVEFAPGASTPTRKLTIPSPFGMVTDIKNNLYVAYNGSDGKGHVEKFRPHAKTGKDLGITVGYVYDLSFTKKSDLVLGDAAGVVDIYPPGKTMPSRSFPTVSPFSFALNQAETRLYVAPSIPEGVSMYNFRTGALLGSITKGNQSPDGVALDPPAAYGK